MRLRRIRHWRTKDLRRRTNPRLHNSRHWPADTPSRTGEAGMRHGGLSGDDISDGSKPDPKARDGDGARRLEAGVNRGELGPRRSG